MPERPTLNIDLDSPDGNIFVVIAKAGALVNKRTKRQIILDGNSAPNYEEALKRINKYVRIRDISGIFYEVV